MNYSKNFERDYDFYLRNVDVFTFCGTLTPKFSAKYDENGLLAKDVFYLIDSRGINKPTREPGVLDKLLMCKSSVNFHIKMWAEGRADGTLPRSEFDGDGSTLFWTDGGEMLYRGSMKEEYGFPDWVITAVEAQKVKILSK